MKITTLLSATLVTVALVGCAAMNAPSAPGAPASAQTGATSDASITARVKAALAADTETAASKIDVETANGNVKLKGEIKSMMLRKKVEAIATGVSGVKAVDNRLVITG